MSLQPPDRSHSLFPLWLEYSGLPLHLNEKGKITWGWAVFVKIVQLDMAANPRRPGLVEIAPNQLAAACGIDISKLEKAIKAMRKCGLLRAFLPDTEEEGALLQIITPLPTPIEADHVRGLHPDLFLDAEWPPRYAVAVVEEDDSGEDPKTGREKIRKVADLYLDVFSMKINPLVLDQLQLIADRYEYPLIKKIFLKAQKEEASSLGWILTQIRREKQVKARIEERKRAEAGHPE